MACWIPGRRGASSSFQSATYGVSVVQPYRLHVTRSEVQSYAAINDAAVEWCPCVNGPSPVWSAIGSEEWVPSCLSDIREVFEVKEELGVLVHSFLTHDAEDHVGP